LTIMIISRTNDQLIITAEDTFDWMELLFSSHFFERFLMA